MSKCGGNVVDVRFHCIRSGCERWMSAFRSALSGHGCPLSPIRMWWMSAFTFSAFSLFSSPERWMSAFIRERWMSAFRSALSGHGCPLSPHPPIRMWWMSAFTFISRAMDVRIHPSGGCPLSSISFPFRERWMSAFILTRAVDVRFHRFHQPAFIASAFIAAFTPRAMDVRIHLRFHHLLRERWMSAFIIFHFVFISSAFNGCPHSSQFHIRFHHLLRERWMSAFIVRFHRQPLSVNPPSDLIRRPLG